jgi:hypothetical protein
VGGTFAVFIGLRKEEAELLHFQNTIPIRVVIEAEFLEILIELEPE